jgi:glutamate-1-semialdehyde 2,1-aminomutase
MIVVAVVQARMGSSRLPGKVLRQIGGTPMIGLLLERLSLATRVDKIVVATSEHPNNAPLVEYVQGMGIACETGSEDDVLDRYVRAARIHKADIVVRITGDCPLVDPALVDEAIGRFEAAEVDYFSNTAPPTYPDGLDIEVFTLGALERAARETNAPYDREHVTPYLKREGSFRQGGMQGDQDLSALRWTVDELADFEVVNRVFEHFAPRTNFSWNEVLDLQRSKPDLFSQNMGIRRNEGAVMGKGQKLWKRAKTVIPGGNMFLSKRAEMHLPERWPAYFSKAKGCQVWDMDGNRYTDMSLMGVGTNLLGYGHAEVDAVVHQTVDAGNMSTLNCPEEVYLAERLVEIHPWADMVRLARTGGEANAIAIRIARAASGRDKVAICGYHGWHDWYLSANLGDSERLAGHHLPGLDPKGVPQNLRGSVLPFNYNDYAALEALATAHDIGVIKMEVMRNREPEDNFLQRVRDLATARRIVLIFDECTSGFRETFGGLYKKYGVEPDMAIFGKALGNGYAITAAIGRREIMEAAQTTFISSSFWSERIGPSAAVKTLEVMERERSWEVVTRTGLDVRRRWQLLADQHGLTIEHWGIPALAGFTVKSRNSLAYKTLITQEMLAKGFLAGNSVYASTEHTPEIVQAYFAALDPVFGLIRECEDGRDVMGLLNSPVCHDGFKRLN